MRPDSSAPEAHPLQYFSESRLASSNSWFEYPRPVECNDSPMAVPAVFPGTGVRPVLRCRWPCHAGVGPVLPDSSKSNVTAPAQSEKESMPIAMTSLGKVADRHRKFAVRIKVRHRALRLCAGLQKNTPCILPLDPRPPGPGPGLLYRNVLYLYLCLLYRPSLRAVERTTHTRTGFCKIFRNWAAKAVLPWAAGVALLQIPRGRAARNSRSRHLERVDHLRRQEPILRMRFRSGSRAVMPPHRLLDLVQHPYPFRVRLPVPEHHKTLTTHAAVQLCVSIRPSAQHLHGCFLLPAGGFPSHGCHNSSGFPRLAIPPRGNRSGLSCQRPITGSSEVPCYQGNLLQAARGASSR